MVPFIKVRNGGGVVRGRSDVPFCREEIGDPNSDIPQLEVLGKQGLAKSSSL